MSTGVFEDHRGGWPELVAEACSVSTYAVELSALSGHEVAGLIAYLPATPRMPFRYMSVHAPVRHRELDEAARARLLSGLPLWVRSIVAHPDALVEPAHYRELGTRLVLENTDDRKRAGRTADELEAVFAELPDAGFCLDVAHASSIDSTMQATEARSCLTGSGRTAAGACELAEGRHHVPLTSGDEQRLASVLARCGDVPWILKPGRRRGGWMS